MGPAATERFITLVFGKSGVPTSTFLALRALATSWPGSHAMASILLFMSMKSTRCDLMMQAVAVGEPMLKRTFELRIKDRDVEEACRSHENTTDLAHIRRILVTHRGPG